MMHKGVCVWASIDDSKVDRPGRARGTGPLPLGVLGVRGENEALGKLLRRPPPRWK